LPDQPSVEANADKIAYKDNTFRPHLSIFYRIFSQKSTTIPILHHQFPEFILKEGTSSGIHPDNVPS
jgi:hypothetical protein